MAESRTNLYLRNVPTRVVRDAKAMAAREGKTLAAFVTESVQRALTGEPSREVDLEFDRDVAWTRAHERELTRQYDGQFVAVLGRAVVDHDAEFDPLVRRVFAEHGQRPIHITRIGRPDAPVRLRSPRLAR